MNLKVNYMTKAFNPFVLKTSHVANIRIPVVFKYNILLIAQKERLNVLQLTSRPSQKQAKKRHNKFWTPKPTSSNSSIVNSFLISRNHTKLQITFFYLMDQYTLA